MTDGGVTFLYASDHAYSEVYEKPPKSAVPEYRRRRPECVPN